MNAPEPRPLEGDEDEAVRYDGNLHPCRECRRRWPATIVCICGRCLVPLCTPCWADHVIQLADGSIVACTGRSFQDTQEGE